MNFKLENKNMIDRNPSQKPAERTRSGNLLAWLLPAALILALLMLFLAGGATASAQVVTNTADSGPGTLRSAITNAASGAVITFAPSLSGTTITLSNTLTINTNLTIDASALPGGLQINGNQSVQIFNVATNMTVFLSSLTITNGYYSPPAEDDGGGGIYNSGILTLNNCTLSGNIGQNFYYYGPTYGGGGIYSDGTLTLNQCTLSGNGVNTSYGDDYGGGIYNSGTLTLTNCTLSGNFAGSDFSGEETGGGIYNVGTTTLDQCTLSGNSTGDEGGGIYNGGLLSLNQCTLSGNSAGGYGSTGFGGGIFNFAGKVTLTNCTVTGNSLNISGGDGGGIYNVNGAMTLNECTLSGNSGNVSGNNSFGGGIYNVGGTLALSQCTLSGNSVPTGYGGGIYNRGVGTATLNQCTLSGNYAGDGGGIYNSAGGTLALNQCTLSGNSAVNNGGGIANRLGISTATMTNTIVGGNSGSFGADIYNSVTFTFGGSNLVQSVDNSGGTITGPAPLTNAPDLAPLDNYGGPTQTMPPLPGSPAIDAGSNAATNNFATDQRGLPRFVGPQVDIGAVEFQASPVVTNADSGPGSLRYAIGYVTNNAPITFAPNLSGATITLSNTLTINTNLTVDASALPGGIQINGNGSVQIFNVASTITVFLNSLTITNGYSTNNGGGIYNGGTLTLTNCTLSGNSAAGALYGDGGGGGIYTVGALTLNQCTLSENSVELYGCGGGIYNQGGPMTLNQCTLSGNNAGGNSYGDDGGGGIYNLGPLTLNQCTLSGNSVANGEGGLGGGIYNYIPGTLALTNTIVAGNRSIYGADDIDNAFATVTSYGGSNLVQSDVSSPGHYYTGPAPLTHAPDLAPLGNYGGPTQTMPPLPGSPAIGAGSVADNTFFTDQRGYSRTQNGLIDLGAVEVQPPAANPAVLENLTVPAGGGIGWQFTFTNAPAADFTVLTATTVSLALTNWTVLGEVQQVAPGQYQFTDPQAATNPARFYRVRSP